MKTHVIYLLLLVGYCHTSLYAQHKRLAPVKTGDILPNLQLTYRIKGQTKTINTADLRGKVVIFDFWNTWCSSCIAAMPEMKKLQDDFQDDLKIILVTNDSDEQVKKHFKKIDSRSSTGTSASTILNSLPSILGDTILNQLFPHQAVPFHIWLDKNGKVVYRTDGTNATPENLKNLLSGNDIKLVERQDTVSFDLSAPLYKEGKGRLLKYLQNYSMFYKEAQEHRNMNWFEGVDSARQTFRLNCTNYTIIDLYRQTTKALYNRTFYAKNRLILEVRDSTKFYWPMDQSKSSSWRTENLYCYELVIPVNQKERKEEIMLEDLNRYLPYMGKVEPRMMDCLALVVLNGAKGFMATESGQPAINFNKDKTLTIRNGTIKELIFNGLSSLNSKVNTPVIDDTGYEGRIDIQMRYQFSDLKLVRQELQKLGLDLVPKRMKVDMLVIRDN